MAVASMERIASARQSSPGGRLIAYLLTGVALLAVYAALRDAQWEGSAHLHTVMEVIATVLALFVGVLALLKFYGFKRNRLYFLGVGFIGAGLLNGYHAVVTAEFFSPYIPSGLPSLIPWSWIASPLYLSLMLWFGWIALLYEQRFGERGRVRESVVYFTAVIILSSCLLFIAFVPLPAVYYANAIIHRPVEFVPALFFLFALIGYLHKGDWRQDTLEHWLVLSLIVSVLGATIFRSRYGEVYGPLSDMAHVLKMASYVLVLVGLLSSMFRLFRQADSNAIRLAAANQAKSRFVATISHEIRNPLNAVRGSLGLLKHAQLKKSERELVQVGQDSADALLAMIDNVLDLSKIEAGKLDLNLVTTGPVQIVDNVVWLTALRAVRDRIKLSSFIEPRVPASIVSDSARLRQILLNLVGNAIKFTPGGYISIRVSVLAGPNLKFEVIDTGSGISQADGARLFQEFSQGTTGSAGSTGGTGLGLAISKRLVELLGGTIDFTSREGRGSTFWFTVPYECPEETYRPAFARNQYAGLCVLLVESDTPWRSDLARQIGAWGMDIEFTTEEALQASGTQARQRHGHFDLVIAPGNPRPNDTGTELLVVYRALSDKLVVLSPAFGVGEVDKKLAEAADYVLGVPVLQEDLWRCLGSMTGRHSEEPEQHAWRLATFEGSEVPDGSRILLAEDSQANRVVGVAMLQQFGFGVDAVASGLEAVEALRTLPYDLVLMDLEMPEMDGLEATRRIRQLDDSKRDIPIIAVTANAMADTAEQCRAVGMNDYVTKPIDAEKLFEVLLRWLPAAEATANSKQISERAAEDEEAEYDERLDRDALARLAKDTAGVPMRTMLEIFIAELRERARALTQAAGAMDISRLASESHALKSGAATFGVRRVAELATELNSACKSNSQIRALELVELLTAETEPAIAALASAYGLEIEPAEHPAVVSALRSEPGRR